MIFNLIKTAKQLFINKKNTGVEADNVEDAISVLKSGLDGKQSKCSGSISTILNADLTPLGVLIVGSDGYIRTSSRINANELNTLEGIKSNVQEQINAINNLFIFSGTKKLRFGTNATYNQVAIDFYANDTTIYKFKFSKNKIEYVKTIDGVSSTLGVFEIMPVGTVIMNQSTSSSGMSYGTWECIGGQKISDAAIGGTNSTMLYYWKRTA
jgi:hypothetical protein